MPMTKHVAANRRDLLLAPLLAAASIYLPGTSAQAAGINPSETALRTRTDIEWKPHYKYPPGTADEAVLFGDSSSPGQYLVLIRWHPGFMSAPHEYVTDRLCIVLSGTWYIANGTDFAPGEAVAAPAGSFVHRAANTVHYDGVIRGAAEPAVIAISGLGPIHYRLIDPGRPGWRES
jgi:hypothetical protein